ncbi:MAG: hypothetical protein IKV13_06695 [Akkermansia sp.]|nr:hypothetical protein [Akkermansia sp.]
MRGVLPALFLATSLPLVAWEMASRSELAAVLGDEVRAAVLEAGLPLPPTREEAQAAAGWRYGLERDAIKRAMVYRTSRIKAERNRITPENNKVTASLARHCGAPELFCQYLKWQVDDTLSRRQQYALNQALQNLLQETYGIDALQIRLVSESLNLAPSDHLLYMLQMPVGGMYDMVSLSPLPSGQLLADIQMMTDVLRRANEVLLTVRDRASAEAAALALQQLLPLWNTTQQARMLMQQGKISPTPAEKLALKLLDTSTVRIVKTRKELQAARWYESTCLQTVDELLR